MYESVRDADFRLTGTVVWFRGDYWYVRGVNGDMKLHLQRQGKRDLIAIDHPELRIRSIPTGYTYVYGRACYLKRLPKRAYRQGLRADNSSVSRCGFGSFVEYVRDGEEVPSKDKIISNDYAALGNELMYRDRVVGVWVDNKPYLNNDMVFLKESVDIAGVRYEA